VLDYRDEWDTLRDSYEMFGPLQRAAGTWLEPALLRRADVVTAATDAFARHLLRRFRFLEVERVRPIPNGYDPDDFPVDAPLPPVDRFALTYAGTVFALTRPVGLIEAIRRLHRDEPALASLLSTRFFGRIVDTEQHLFVDADKLGIECTGYVDKSRALNEQAASHMNLCLLDDVPGTERIYPGKVFELMHLGRPCLTLAPPGALTELVERHRLGPIVHPREPAAIAVVLERALRAFQAGRSPVDKRPVGIERFHRRAVAGEFARAFRDAAQLARARAGRNRRAA
jgi:glycosyltransferase involved in cell wall biosynthesis